MLLPGWRNHTVGFSFPQHRCLYLQSNCGSKSMEQSDDGPPTTQASDSPVDSEVVSGEMVRSQSGASSLTNE